MKLTLYGPAQDGMFVKWQVIGPRGGIKAEFLTKKAAKAYIKDNS
jgi:hypothetical protein